MNIKMAGNLTALLFTKVEVETALIQNKALQVLIIS